MIKTITIIERLEQISENGRTSASLWLWKKQIKKLQKDGFEVTLIKSSSENKGLFHCLICWDKAPINSIAHRILDLSTNENY